MTIQIYGHPKCPDCVELGAFLQANAGRIDYEGHPITELANLKAFLKLREGPEFDRVRAAGSIGIPALVEDGKVSLDWKAFFEAKGFKTEAAAAPAACSLDGKGC